MQTPKNLEEGRPIEQPVVLEISATSKDSIKYDIKISNVDEKVTITTSYKKGLICKEYFSSYELTKLLENQYFSFKNTNDYLLFLKDIIEKNKIMKLDNVISESDGGLCLIIPSFKEIKLEIKEKELSDKERQKNIIEFMNKIYLENEELKKKVDELQIENKKISDKLEETKKNLELKSDVKNIERIKNLFKDSAIIKEDEKKMINDWIDPYSEKNITSELLFRTSVDGDNSNTFHNKCNGKGPTITFVKTTAGKRIGGYTSLPWTNDSSYKKDLNAFIFSLDANQKFVQWRYFDNAVYHHSSYGPTFGNGHDLYIANGCKGNTSSYCNSNYSYGFFNSYNMINTGYQQTNFQVADYEVYLIKVNK